MTEIEFDNIKSVKDENYDKDWLHRSFGVIKKYYRDIDYDTENNTITIINTHEILKDLTTDDAIILKSFGWNIINNKLQKQLA